MALNTEHLGLDRRESTPRSSLVIYELLRLKWENQSFFCFKNQCWLVSPKSLGHSRKAIFTIFHSTSTEKTCPAKGSFVEDYFSGHGWNAKRRVDAVCSCMTCCHARRLWYIHIVGQWLVGGYCSWFTILSTSPCESPFHRGFLK